MAGKKILVADDSLTIQKVIRLALSGDGYEIQTVSDGKEAIEQTSLFRPDICIIDVSLPTKDAYQIKEEFMTKPDLKNIPVVLMSSAFEKVDEARMSTLGFAGHLIKPFDPSHLRSTLLSVSTNTPKNDPIEESIKDAGDFSLEPKTADLTRFQFKEFRTSPAAGTFRENPVIPQPEVQPVDDIQELAKNTFELSGLDQQDWGVIEPIKDEQPVQHMPGNLSSEPHYATAPSTLTLSHEEVEAMVKNEVMRLIKDMRGQIDERIQQIISEEFRTFSQTKMPDIAEKVLKEEIHRLLSEPPV